jgi:hypothetical protein
MAPARACCAPSPLQVHIRMQMRNGRKSITTVQVRAGCRPRAVLAWLGGPLQGPHAPRPARRQSRSARSARCVCRVCVCVCVSVCSPTCPVTSPCRYPTHGTERDRAAV